MAQVHQMPKRLSTVRLMDGSEIQTKYLGFTEHGVKVWADGIGRGPSVFYPYENIQWVQS